MRDAHIGAGAVIHPFTHIEGARVGPGALIGPFARLRPGAELGAEVHIGNFVEVKNSTLAAFAKANHLAYLGDATVGERVNFGAQFCARPQPRKRANERARPDLRAFNVRERVDHRTRADVRVAHDAVGADVRAVFDGHRAFEDAVDVNLDILAAMQAAS